MADGRVLVLAVTSGGLLEAAMLTTVASFAFRSSATYAVQILLGTTLMDFGGYPIGVFGRDAALLFTFAFPLAFIAYFPVVIVLNRQSELLVPVWMAYSSPLVALLGFALSIQLFGWQSRKYASAGA